MSDQTQFTESQQRAAVVAEARTWLRTPYHHMGRVKNAGCDCYTLLLEVFLKIGMFTAAMEAEVYPPDWFLHATDDHYKMRILRHAREMVESFCSRTEMTQPGNVVLLRASGKRGSIDMHGGIIAEWPKVIHAAPPCVNLADVRYHPAFTGGRLEFYSPWPSQNQKESTSNV